MDRAPRGGPAALARGDRVGPGPDSEGARDRASRCADRVRRRRRGAPGAVGARHALVRLWRRWPAPKAAPEQAPPRRPRARHRSKAARRPVARMRPPDRRASPVEGLAVEEPVAVAVAPAVDPRRADAARDLGMAADRSPGRAPWGQRWAAVPTARARADPSATTRAGRSADRSPLERTARENASPRWGAKASRRRLDSARAPRVEPPRFFENRIDASGARSGITGKSVRCRRGPATVGDASPPLRTHSPRPRGGEGEGKGVTSQETYPGPFLTFAADEGKLGHPSRRLSVAAR